MSRAGGGTLTLSRMCCYRVLHYGTGRWLRLLYHTTAPNPAPTTPTPLRDFSCLCSVRAWGSLEGGGNNFCGGQFTDFSVTFIVCMMDFH